MIRFLIETTIRAISGEAQRKRVDIVGRENYQEDLLARIVEEFPRVAKVVAAWGPPGGDRGKQLGQMGLKKENHMGKEFQATRRYWLVPSRFPAYRATQTKWKLVPFTSLSSMMTLVDVGALSILDGPRRNRARH